MLAAGFKPRNGALGGSHARGDRKFATTSPVFGKERDRIEKCEWNGLRHARGESDAKRAGDLEDGVKARFGARGEGFVEAFAAKSGVFCDLGDAARARDIAECG